MSAATEFLAGLVRTPELGAPVHYTAYGTPNGEYRSVCRAATITQVGGWATRGGSDPETDEWTDGDVRYRQLLQAWEPDRCALKVDNPTGTFHNECSFSKPPRNEDGSVIHPGGTWHWPGQC